MNKRFTTIIPANDGVIVNEKIRDVIIPYDEMMKDPALKMDLNRGDALIKYCSTLTDEEFLRLTNYVIDKLFAPDRPPLIDRVKVKLFLEAVNYDRDVIALSLLNEDGSLIREVTGFNFCQLAIAAKKKVGM